MEEIMKKIIFIILISLVLTSCYGQKIDVEGLFSEDEDELIQLNDMDLSQIDLDEYEDQLLEANFTTLTKWPATLPSNFSPNDLLELGKNPGLKINDLHDEGYTGKGVGIAIIDSKLLKSHTEFSENFIYYEELHEKPEGEDFYHGTAVASIAVGKNIGVAPEADLYFFAEGRMESTSFSDNEVCEAVAEDIEYIIELNKGLENKIRVISISRGFMIPSTNYEILQEAIDKAKEANIEVFSSDTFEVYNFGTLQRIPYADPDIPESYIASHLHLTTRSAFLSIPMSSRTVANYRGNREYEYDGRGGYSWSIPYLAGVYALACQADSKIDFETFLEIANETSYSSDLEYNSKYYMTDMIIQPYSIIQELIK